MSDDQKDRDVGRGCYVLVGVLIAGQAFLLWLLAWSIFGWGWSTSG